MLDFTFDVYNFRLLSALVMLSVAAVIDIRKREINDSLWIAFGLLAAVFIFFEHDKIIALKTLGISLIIAPIALVLWRTGIFGGADALGLIVLAALAPNITLSGNTITPLTTLTNAAILSTTPLFVNFIRNMIAIYNHENIFEGFDETRLKKMAAVFLGYRSKNPKYSFSIEKTSGNSKKLDFSLRNVEREHFCNSSNAWVTPGIPYMLYIAGGFTIQLLFGDIIFNIIGNFLTRV